MALYKSITIIIYYYGKIYRVTVHLVVLRLDGLQFYLGFKFMMNIYVKNYTDRNVFLPGLL